MDDTPTRERIRLQHRGANTANGLGAGSFIEMQSTGDVIHKVYGDGYSIIAGNNYVLINGVCNITVQGDAYLHVMGDKVEQIDGNYELHVKGDYLQTIEGNADISSVGNMDIGANPIFGGQMSITAGDSLVVDTDLTVTGELSAGKITSVGRVDAGTGVSAGPLGFVSLLGGLSIGLPAAAPLNIVCSGPISSLTSVNAPLGNFGISNSILGFDVVNLLLHNTHTHPAPTGVTGPPVPFEVA
jgi:hypothetical protein